MSELPACPVCGANLDLRHPAFPDFIQNKYGYCYFEIEPGENPIIYNLYVHPQYRRRGHAKKLLQYVINEIRQFVGEGIIDIEASPREDSISLEKLVNLYESLGLNVLPKSGPLLSWVPVSERTPEELKYYAVKVKLFNNPKEKVWISGCFYNGKVFSHPNYVVAWLEDKTQEDESE